MDWITIHNDHESLRKDLVNHFYFRIKKEFSNSKTIWIITGLLLMLVIFITLSLRSYGLKDLIFSFLLTLWILYYVATLVVQRVKINRWLRNLKNEIPKAYLFKFDENGYSYKTENYTTEFKWSYFEYFEFNEKEAVIYLYKNKRLVDIMASRLSENGNFEKIFALIRSNIAPRID
jgi:hypothetical protein